MYITILHKFSILKSLRIIQKLFHQKDGKVSHYRVNNRKIDLYSLKQPPCPDKLYSIEMLKLNKQRHHCNSLFKMVETSQRDKTKRKITLQSNQIRQLLLAQATLHRVFSRISGIFLQLIRISITN
jgi:ATP sulfurylase